MIIREENINDRKIASKESYNLKKRSYTREDHIIPVERSFTKWWNNSSFKIVNFQFKDRILSVWGSWNFSLKIVKFQFPDLFVSVLGSLSLSVRIVNSKFEDRYFLVLGSRTFSFKIVNFQFKDRILSVWGSWNFRFVIVFVIVKFQF